ncbi:MAG: DUF4335 domain-containing protein [Cyanobacteria bacterium P01_A01_bin.17]
MTIQRQYLLPNCTLTLEGLSNAIGTQELRPSLDTLMRFECHFAKLDQTLVGGLDFLESLIQATSECTQSWMSGVQHTKAKRKARSVDQVQLQPATDGQFQMSVPTGLLSSTAGSETQSVDLQLSTVQLFDLSEALDQLLADSQTLPNLSSNIQPLSRKEALSGQPLAKRAAPLALGTVSLAIATSALYFIPAPEISRPKDEPIPTETPVIPGTSSPPTGETAPVESGTSPASPAAPSPETP